MLVAEETVEVRVLKRQGKSIRAIARMLNVSRSTVRRYLRSQGHLRYECAAGPDFSKAVELLAAIFTVEMTGGAHTLPVQIVGISGA